jgi:hypothetical protein
MEQFTTENNILNFSLLWLTSCTSNACVQKYLLQTTTQVTTSFLYKDVGKLKSISHLPLLHSQLKHSSPLGHRLMFNRA